MKELLVVSGKGGTGKTSLVGALATLATDKVLADCDVDAADLHLLLSPTPLRREDFIGGKIAVIDPERCTGCGRCRELCRFGAVTEDFTIERTSCEGCGVCAYFCPEEAIEMRPRLSGELLVSSTRYGPLVHARLGIAEEASGKLVARVRQVARQVAEEHSLPLIIADGPPGVGCPVIASVSGADAVLIVAEPTLAALHDMGRVAQLCAHFKTPAVLVCLNKADLNPEVAVRVKSYCAERGLSFLGEVPYDLEVTRAQVEGRSVMERGGEAARAIAGVWARVVTQLQLGQE